MARTRIVCGARLIAAAAALVVAPPPLSPAALTRWDAGAVERARSGAIRRLQKAHCGGMLADFRDAQGHTLEQNLEELRLSADDYLRALPFLDGSREPLCRRRTNLLVTAPGLHRVMVCGTFADFQVRQPRLAESVVLHELLHTLGLGENPPTSTEITARVEARCR